MSRSLAALIALTAISNPSSVVISSWYLSSRTPYATIEPDPVDMYVSSIIPPAGSREYSEGLSPSIPPSNVCTYIGPERKMFAVTDAAAFTLILSLFLI